MYSGQEFSCKDVNEQETYNEGLSIVDITSRHRTENTFSVTVYAQKAVSIYSSLQYYGNSRVKAEA